MNMTEVILVQTVLSSIIDRLYRPNRKIRHVGLNAVGHYDPTRYAVPPQ